MSGSLYEYQSRFRFEKPGMSDWELDEFNRRQREKDYCEQCNHSVGEDPKFFGVGGFLTGPFCSQECAWEWLHDDCETPQEDDS